MTNRIGIEQTMSAKGAPDTQTEDQLQSQKTKKYRIMMNFEHDSLLKKENIVHHVKSL